MKAKIYVIKENGQNQLYDRSKLVTSIFRAGVPQSQVSQVVGEVEAKIYNSISTHKLYQLVFSEIDNLNLELPSKLYRIREMLAQSDSLIFEKIIADILKIKDYSCKWNVMVEGFCVAHQMDIVMEKNNQRFLVEVKRHKNFHRDTGFGDIIEMWGRFLDINQRCKQENVIQFSQAFLVTNTKFSDHAKQFALCRNLGLLGWRFDTIGLNSQKDFGLEKTIEDIGQKKVIDLIIESNDKK